jgi:hypothetical protein
MSPYLGIVILLFLIGIVVWTDMGINYMGENRRYILGAFYTFAVVSSGILYYKIRDCETNESLSRNMQTVQYY